MTKTQEKHEKSIKGLEEKFQKIIADFRGENEAKNFKKRQIQLLSEISYYFSDIHQRLSPKNTRPLLW